MTAPTDASRGPTLADRIEAVPVKEDWTSQLVDRPRDYDYVQLSVSVAERDLIVAALRAPRPVAETGEPLVWRGHPLSAYNWPKYLRDFVAPQLKTFDKHEILRISDALDDLAASPAAPGDAVGTLEAENILLRKYCSAAASDYAGLLDTMEQAAPSCLQGFFQKTAAELRETSEFMALAAEGHANGLLYDDEVTRLKRELAEAKRQG